MSYFDEIKSLVTSGGDDILEAQDTLAAVRSQLEESTLPFVEGPEGTFTMNATRRGCGFAQGTLVVDEEAGTCSMDINTHIRVAPENAIPVRRMLRMLNNTLIQTGLVLDDDNIVHFVPESPIDIRGGQEIDVAVGRAISTIHKEAWKFTAIAAGAKPWDLV